MRDTGNIGTQDTRWRQKHTRKKSTAKYVLHTTTHKTQDEDKQIVGHHCTQTNTNNVDKTWVNLPTIGGQDEPNIVFMRKS